MYTDAQGRVVLTMTSRVETVNVTADATRSVPMGSLGRNVWIIASFEEKGVFWWELGQVDRVDAVGAKSGSRSENTGF